MTSVLQRSATNKEEACVCNSLTRDADPYGPRDKKQGLGGRFCLMFQA